jgi:hypothetical protein
MSDTEKPAESAEPTTPTAPATPRPTSMAPKGLLSHDSDAPVRPGFRSPANKNSKAQKATRKKR